ncbi:hypothetical protein EDB85DRAFT_2271805 [Lactarius pseudohatsudake]|nr:hypothetical protein EDB85DRAFT_2271805 [Lactarius pseudohatsudake]
MAHYDIFRHHLLITAPAYGYALWDPDPGNLYPAVEVGDVGYIREGRFHRLFNVLLPAKHPSHRKGVPEYHEQLNVEDHIIHGTLSPHNFCSTCVALGPESDRQADGPQNEGEVSFLCRMNQGAVLCLPIKAKKEDTVAIKRFGKWMIKHIDTWFAWAQQLELGVDRMEDIILVTGTHRTRSCTNVAFPGGREDARVSFRAKVDRPDDTVTINWQFSHEHIRGAHLNPGPDGKNLPEDQCIFIRGFRVARKYKIFPRLKAAAGPNPDPEGSDEEPDMDMELVPVPTVPEYRDPLHILLGFIAEEAPHCDMVLVHDNDLAELHGIYDSTPIESLQPDAVLSRFRSAELKIHEIPLDRVAGMLIQKPFGWLPFQTFLKNCLLVAPSPTSSSSQSRCHVKAPLPQIERSLLHVPLQGGGHTLLQWSESGDNSATSMSHAHPVTTNVQEPIVIALKEFEERTGVNILEYHLAIELESCYSAHSVIEILQAQSRESQRLRDHGDKLMVWVKPVVHLLYALSTRGALGEDVSAPLPPTMAIFAGIGVLINATDHTSASNDALFGFFESMENLLRPLDICTEIPPTTSTTTMLMKILVELLSILSLGVQQVEQGLLLVQYDTIDLGSKLFGIKGVEVVRQRLGQLDQEEARATVVQTLEVVHGLLKNMKVVMNGGQARIHILCTPY